jgi:hypothetical protein
MQFVIPNYVLPNSPAFADQMEENFDYIADFYNGNLEGDNVGDEELTGTKVTNQSLVGENFSKIIDSAHIQALNVTHAKLALPCIAPHMLWPRIANQPLIVRQPFSPSDPSYAMIIKGRYPLATTIDFTPDNSTPGVAFESWDADWDECISTDAPTFINYEPDISHISIIPNDFTNATFLANAGHAMVHRTSLSGCTFSVRWLTGDGTASFAGYFSLTINSYREALG